MSTTATATNTATDKALERANRIADLIDWTAIRSDDGWMRDAECRAQLIIAERAADAHTVQALAELAAADERAQAILPRLAADTSAISPAALGRVNRALDTVEPGLQLGTISVKSAVRVLSDYLTLHQLVQLLTGERV